MAAIAGEKYQGPGNTGNISDNWLDKSGTAGSDARKDLIVGAADDQEAGTYYYSVEVEHVGQLDPRADFKD